MKAKILLVDDDVAVLAALAGVLESEDFRVLYALDGHQAMMVVEKHEDVRLVLMDLNMPVRDGWASLNWMQSVKRHVPVIVITGQPGQSIAAIASGAAALLEKPLNIGLLLETIHDTLSDAEMRRAAAPVRREEALVENDLV